MAQYPLAAGALNDAKLKAAVGKSYNIGLSDGTRYYGYQLQNWGTQTKQRRLYGASVQDGFVENSDITTRGALTQYGSPNLVDRDLVYYPRVSQGDFSGGSLQTVLIDPTKYYDSDLEIRTPGYLTLRPGWARQLLVASTGTYQCVAFNSSVYTCLGTTNVYKADGTSIAMGSNATRIDTDGNVLFVSDGANVIKQVSIGNAVTVLFTGTGALKNMWYVAHGTAGRFLYYTNDNIALNKIDVAAATSVLVPTATTPFTLVDLCPYQTGIAILTKDGSGSGDVWYFDGAAMTRIVHISQYTPIGMCNALGSLFVTAQSTGQYEAPALFRIDSGSISVVARLGSPTSGLSATGIGAPTSSGQYVYWPTSAPQVNNVSISNYIGVYDLLTGAYSHLGNMDSNDGPSVTLPRQIAASGRAVTFPMALSGSSYLQYQSNSSVIPAGGSAFASTGTLVSSRLDFATPSIPKRFRRVEVVHAPLLTGQSVKISAYVDLDPSLYVLAMTPTPTGATTTNTTAGSAVTALTMGADTVGRSMYFAVTLTGPGTSSPKVTRLAVEVGGTWVWDLDLDCSSNRRLLTQDQNDPQGVVGKDLYYLIRNAYENGSTLTLYLAENVTYTVAIETVGGNNVSYMDKSMDGTIINADAEWLCHVVLRQVA